MAYSSNLLFNNVFLKNLQPSEEEMAAARYLVHESARDWYREDNLTSPHRMAENWIKPLLNQQSLDLVPTDVDENAWIIAAPWDREAPLALCYVAPAETDLGGYTPDKTIPKGQQWMIRAVELARRSDADRLRWVVLTNGVQWRLLDAEALRCYEAYLEIDLYSLLNGERDPLAAYLFYRLFRLEDSLERDERTGRNRLDAFLEQSIKATEETEAYLKTAVSDNLSTPGSGDGIMGQLCMGIVNAVDPSGTKSFAEQERTDIYGDATYLLYRLLFILYAEARHLLPMNQPEYQAVSLNSLIDEAVELRASPQGFARRRTDLWDQLSTLFSAIHYSDEYLGIPAYNGGLFDNKDKPYLSDSQIENAYLAEALFELAFLPDSRAQNTPERIDYCDLSVRHLGSLYEGMIEYQLFIAEEELLARQVKGGKVKYLRTAEHTKKPSDEVVRPGKVYFAQSPHERKATGTHYTPEDLVARLVKQTVGRLLDERWERFASELERMMTEIEATPPGEARARLQAYADSQLEAFVHEQVLSLRICDPAVGSGHFLVYVAHTLTNYILWVLSSTPWDNPAINLDPCYWRRLVVENCLYGVDINGMAVELAKLSLWVATMEYGRPLSFLDHHLKQGNTLLGVPLEEIRETLSDDDLNRQTQQTRAVEERGQHAFRTIPKVMEALKNANQKLEVVAHRIVAGAEDIAAQESEYGAVRRALAPYRQIGDILVAQKMGLKIRVQELRSITNAMEAEAPEMLTGGQLNLVEQCEGLLQKDKTFHWELEFPEVFFPKPEARALQGFDAVVGNPPFLGGLKISRELGNHILRFVKAHFDPSVGAADYCTYFFRKGFSIVAPNGYLGLVATNSIAQGDSRETGLEVIIEAGGLITYADRYVEWKGEASVEVNLVAIRKMKSDTTSPRSVATLDGEIVPYISSHLDDLPDAKLSALSQNENRAFQGDIPYGKGFFLDRDEALELIENRASNQDCLFPYLNGYDVNNDPSQKSDRYAICFHDWSLEKAKAYPDLIKIVEARVKPQRDRVNRERNRKKWWLYGEYRRGMRDAIYPLDSAIVRSAVSELHMLSFVSTEQILSCKLVVFAYDDHFHFSLLQSHIHNVWLRRNATTLRTDISYSISKCFDTFPFPQMASYADRSQAEESGKAYYRHRQQVMLRRQRGLTKTYNLFHDRDCLDEDIQDMRCLHAEMDQAILACYAWEDIRLDHDFYANDRGNMRYMPSMDAQREIFSRLIALNQEVAASEAA